METKVFPEYQEKYLADPKSGPCPCFKAGDTFILKRTGSQDDFYHLVDGKFCGEAWDAVSRYVYTALQGGSIMHKWTNDERMMITCCNDGTRPVISIDKFNLSGSYSWRKIGNLMRWKVAQHIIVTEYNPLWAKMFEAEAVKLEDILGENCIAIHHIGSTSVIGLAAKPIIDIMPIVYNLEDVDKVATEFEKIGYEYMGEFGISGRRYLRKGGDERTHQIHIFSKKSIYDIERHLAVRDYLRSHPATCEQYAGMKRKLAKKYPYDIEGYCDGKEEFVQQLEKEALEWKGRKSSTQ